MTHGPIQGYQQHFFGEVLGPFMIIGSILQWQQWAHMKPLAAFLQRNCEPNQGYWQQFLGDTVGPFITISNILQQHQWAHAMVSAVFLETNAGPIHDH